MALAGRRVDVLFSTKKQAVGNSNNSPKKGSPPVSAGSFYLITAYQQKKDIYHVFELQLTMMAIFGSVRVSLKIPGQCTFFDE